MKIILVTLALSTGAAAGAIEVSAQNSIDTIVITAQKREQSASHQRLQSRRLHYGAEHLGGRRNGRLLFRPSQRSRIFVKDADSRR